MELPEQTVAENGDVSEVVNVRAARTRRAFLAHLRNELLAPAEAMVGYCEAMQHDLQEAPSEFAADILKMYAASLELFGLVQRLLDPEALSAHSDGFAQKLSGARHDIGNELNQVKGYCQLLLMQDEAQMFGALRADLEQMLKFCADCEQKLLASRTAAVDRLGVVPYASAASLVTEAAEVILPRAPDDPGITREPPGSVLLAEDNEASRLVIARLLQQQGHTVHLAGNGREALALIEAQPVDVVLMDILMPEMNGFLALRHLKSNSKTRHIPVIMTSALDEIHSVVRCIEIGAEDYLPKPVDRVLLEARLNACLEKKRLRDREVRYLQEIEEQRKRADDLLHVIMPPKIVTELKQTNTVKPQRYARVAVMFADIVGFTPYCDKHEPEEVLTYLQRLAEAWEDIALRYHVEKIKTIGDALMAACGLLLDVENPVLNIVRCGIEMMEAVKVIPNWNVRIGIHIGPVVAGILGRRQYLFDLWGDTVNTAARMESHGTPGRITLTRDAWESIRDRATGEWHTIQVKGKGEQQVFRLASLTD